MATEILRPSAAGDETGIQYLVGDSHHEAVDDVSPDEWTTMVWQESATPGRDLYGLPDSAIGAGIINSVTVYFRCSGGYSTIYNSYAAPSLKVGGVVYNGTTVNIENYPNFTTFSQTWTSKPGGGAWGSDWSIINSMQAGVMLQGGGTEASRTYCTQVYVEINYTPAPETYTKTVDMDILLQAEAVKTSTIDALVRGAAQRTVALGAIIGEYYAQETALDVLLSGKVTAGVGLDMLVGGTEEKETEITFDTILTAPVPLSKTVTLQVEAMDLMSQLASGVVLDYTAMGIIMTYLMQSPSYGGIINAMVDDDDYVYAAGSTTNTIRKYLKADLTLVAESPSYGGQIFALAADDTYIYAAGDNTNREIRKYLKSTMALSLAGSAEDGPILALVADDTYLYSSVPIGSYYAIRKYAKTTLAVVATSGYHDDEIYALTLDDTYIYAGIYEPPPYDTYLVWKVLKADLSSIDTSPDYGGIIYALDQDDDYIYAGGANQTVCKYLKTDMSLVAESSGYGGNILDIKVSEDYVYAAGSTTNEIHRFGIGDLAAIDESPSYGGGISSLVLDDDYIYAAGGTTQTVRKYKLFQVVDKIIDELLAFPMQLPVVTKGDISDYADKIVPLKIDGQTILQAALTLRKSLGGYMEVNNDRELDWFTTIGEDKGQQIRYGKNLVGISREIDYTKLFNRIYVYGRDADGNRIKLSDIQDEDYIEDVPSQTTYKGIYVGVFTNFSITGAAALLTWAQELLAQYKDPPTTYAVDAVDLSIQQQFAFEALQLGSQVTVIDEDLNIEISTTVVRIFKPDLLNPMKMQIELANAVRDITDSLAAFAQGQKKHDMLLIGP